MGIIRRLSRPRASGGHYDGAAQTVEHKLTFASGQPKDPGFESPLRHSGEQGPLFRAEAMTLGPPGVCDSPPPTTAKAKTYPRRETVMQKPHDQAPRNAGHYEGKRPGLRARDSNTGHCEAGATPAALTKNLRQMDDIRIIDLTVSELRSLIRRSVAEALSDLESAEKTPDFVYGIKGLAELLNISERQARYIKNRGDLRGAIRQSGRTIVTDARKALELFGKS